MTSFSQNNEDNIVSKYFGNYKGCVLSIGENDGITFSNSRILILQGWSACLIEPSDWAFEKLLRLYDNNDKIILVKEAIGNESGLKKFYDSDTLLNKGDKCLVSTLHPKETHRWKGVVQFKETETSVITFAELKEYYKVDTADFISIDAEGNDWDILQQVDLDEMKCMCLCIEHNSQQSMIVNYTNYCSKFGMKELHRNQENIIFVR